MRTPEEIQADLDAATEARQNVKVGKYRVELIESLYAERSGNSLPRVEAPQADSQESLCDQSEPDYWETDEGRFVRDSLANMPFDNNQRAGLSKARYNDIKYRRDTYCFVRAVLRAQAEGAASKAEYQARIEELMPPAWPQFAALGLRASDGSPEPERRPAEEPQPPSIAPVTAGGMPVRQGKPSPEEVMGIATGNHSFNPREEIAAELGARTRPEPVTQE